LSDGKTYFKLYSGRVAADLDAYGVVAGKRIPLAALELSHQVR